MSEQRFHWVILGLLLFTCPQTKKNCLIIQLPKFYHNASFNSLYLHKIKIFKRYSFIRKKSVLLQSRHIFQVKVYFYTHGVKLFNWIETYQMHIIFTHKHILGSSHFFSWTPSWVLRKTLLALHFIYVVKRRIVTLLIWWWFLLKFQINEV